MADEDRAERALALRLAGVDWITIAERLGYDDASEALDAVLALADRQFDDQSLDPHRILEVLRLDRLQAALWGAAMKGDVEAIKTVLSIGDRRTRMLRLNLRST